MDLTPETTIDTLGVDQRWIGSTHGLDSGQTGTLVTATVQAHKNALGVLSAGVLLGVVTASGDYALFNPAAVDGSEVLAGVLLSDVRVASVAGVAIAKVGISVLRHGTVRRTFLPVVAQRAQVDAALATSTAQLLVRD